MTADDFNATQKRLGMSRSKFCRALGIAQNTGHRYALGRSPIPKYIALACAALVYGLPPIGENQ